MKKILLIATAALFAWTAADVQPAKVVQRRISAKSAKGFVFISRPPFSCTDKVKLTG